MLPLLEEEFVKTGKVYYVYKDFIVYGQESEKLAQLARCAGVQGKFWPVHDWLYANQDPWKRKSNLWELVFGGISGSGLDLGAARDCLDQNQFQAAVSAMQDEATRIGARGTPTFLVNGRTFTGYVPWPRFKAIIEQVLVEDQEK